MRAAARLPPGLCASIARNSAITQRARQARRGGDRGARATTRRPSIAVPQPGAPPGAPQPTVPRSLPDPRSLFLDLHYSLARAAGAADARRAWPTRASATSTTAVASTSATTCRARRASASSTAGGSRRRIRRRRCPSRSSRSPSGSTAPSRCKYRDADHAPACSSGTRRSRRSASRTRCVVEVQPDDADFDTLDVGARLDPLDDQRRAVVRRHRPEPGRPAQRRDPRRRHRASRACRRATCARCARRSLVAPRPARRAPFGSAGRRPRSARVLRARRVVRPTPTSRPSSWATRSTCSRRAASSTRQPRGAAVRRSTT